MATMHQIPDITYTAAQGLGYRCTHTTADTGYLAGGDLRAYRLVGPDGQLVEPWMTWRTARQAWASALPVIASAIVLGRLVRVDRSGGHGHCWRVAYDLWADVREEIAAEIIDGGKEECADYVASDGEHYRWS